MRRTKIIIYSGFRKIELFLKRFYLLSIAMMLILFFGAMVLSPVAKQGQYFMQILREHQTQNLKMISAMNNAVVNLDSTVRLIRVQSFAYQEQNKQAWKIIKSDNERLSQAIATLNARQNFYNQIIIENSKSIDKLYKNDSINLKVKTSDPPVPDRQIILREWIKN